jgi:hypothetical protein
MKAVNHAQGEAVVVLQGSRTNKAGLSLSFPLIVPDIEMKPTAAVLKRGYELYFLCVNDPLHGR